MQQSNQTAGTNAFPDADVDHSAVAYSHTNGNPFTDSHDDRFDVRIRPSGVGHFRLR
jgi:hypothetical protein